MADTASVASAGSGLPNSAFANQDIHTWLGAKYELLRQVYGAYASAGDADSMALLSRDALVTMLEDACKGSTGVFSTGDMLVEVRDHA